MKLLAGILALGLLCSAARPHAQPHAGFPSTEEFTRRVRQAVQLDSQVQKDFTYVEKRRDVKISRLGKVSIGPLRTFEVTPSAVPGQTYKRLIAVDGTPLPPAELARRDAEHERDLQEARAREARESPSQRSERLARLAAEERQRQAILDDAFKAFDAVVQRREVVDGQKVLVARMTPRKDPPVTTREGKWMSHFEGELCVAEADYQLVKVDMQATSDVTIGWGVVGRIHKGSSVLYVRRHFENAWLPSETTYQASGRTLIFRPFQFKVTTTYSEYKRRSPARPAASPDE